MLDERVVRILRYHSVGSRSGRLTISPDVFEHHMLHIRQRFHVMPVEQIEDYLRGAIVVTKPVVSVSFDDGFLDTYEIAFPILKKLDIPVVIFVIANKVGDLNRSSPSLQYSHHCDFETLDTRGVNPYHTFRYPRRNL